MGIYSAARIWYGANGEVPKKLNQECDEPENSDNRYEFVKNGVCIERIFSYDQQIGVGGTLAHNYAGDTTRISFDFPDINIKNIQETVDSVLDEFGYDGERGWYLTAYLS